MMFKQMAMRCHGSSIYITLSIALFTGCQSNVNLPPDKVVEKEEVVRAHAAATVNNRPTAQENTNTKAITREREQADDEVSMPLQDNRSKTQKNTDTKAVTREREQADDTSHTDLQEGIDTDVEVSGTEIEQEMITNMLYFRDAESVHSSDDEKTERDYAALNASTEEDKEVLDQLAKDVVHEGHAVMLGIPGSTQE